MLPQRPPFASRPLLPPLLLRLLHPLQRQSPLSQLHQSRRHPLPGGITADQKSRSRSEGPGDRYVDRTSDHAEQETGVRQGLR